MSNTNTTREAQASISDRFPERFIGADATSAEVKDWAEEAIKTGGVRDLLLVGLAGTGKSWNGHAALKAFVLGRAAAGVATTWDEVVHYNLQPHDAERSALLGGDIVLIDDFNPAWGRTDEVADLLEERCLQRRPTIMTVESAYPVSALPTRIQAWASGAAVVVLTDPIEGSP